jgi:alginate O-acetyltransferase complex protein AlgI
MVFSSHLFIFYFLPVVLLLNYTLPFRFLSLMLVCVSYCFYGWMNPKWILLMSSHLPVNRKRRHRRCDQGFRS